MFLDPDVSLDLLKPAVYFCRIFFINVFETAVTSYLKILQQISV